MNKGGKGRHGQQSNIIKEAQKMKKLILSLCDYTGNWPYAYAELLDEYEVVSIDLQTGTDVLTYEPSRQPYGVLAAPPCTYFAVSGARWFNDPIRRPKSGLDNAIAIVEACVRIGKTATNFFALENPVGTIRRHVPSIGEKLLTFNPCDYAGFAPDPLSEAYTKKTLIYGRFNANLPTNRVAIQHEKGSSPIHKAPPGPDRANFRSATPLGFAKAFFMANR